MKTTKVNRIEIEPKDNNVEIVLGGGTLTITVKPNGTPYVMIDADPHYSCGNPILSLQGEIALMESNPHGADKHIKDAEIVYPNVYGVCVGIPNSY